MVFSSGHLKNLRMRLYQGKKRMGEESDSSAPGIRLSWAERRLEIQPCAA